MHHISDDVHKSFLEEQGWTEEEYLAGFQRNKAPRDGSARFLEYEALVARELAKGEVSRGGGVRKTGDDGGMTAVRGERESVESHEYVCISASRRHSPRPKSGWGGNRRRQSDGVPRLCSFPVVWRGWEEGVRVTSLLLCL